MRNIIHEIRNQPHHVRELATVLCTIVVVAVVALVWFRSFQNNIYALLNPEEQTQAQDKLFAQESKSLFGSILQVLSDGKAQIFSLFSGQSNQLNISNPQTAPESGTAHPLPVSGSR